MLLVRLAWRNLWRHKRRTLITASAMAIGVALCLWMMALIDGMMLTMREVMVEERMGHVQVVHPDYPGKEVMYDTLDEALLDEVSEVQGLAVAAPRLYGGALVGNEEGSTGARVMGVLPEREAALTGLDADIRVGRMLSAEPAGEVLVGPGLVDELGLEVGERLTFMTQSADGSIGNDAYEIVGVFRSGNAPMEQAGVYLHLAELQELLVLPGQIHELTITGSDPYGELALEAGVQAAIGERPTEGDGAVLVQTWQEASPDTAKMLAMSQSSGIFMLGIVFAVAAVGVLNTMLMSVFERTRELGIAKAVGLKPGGVVLMVLAESFWLGLVSAALGAVLGGALDLYMARYGIDFSASDGEGFDSMGVMFDPVFYGDPQPYQFVLTTVCVLLVALLSSLWPAWRAARLEPVQAMRDQ